LSIAQGMQAAFSTNQTKLRGLIKSQLQ